MGKVLESGRKLSQSLVWSAQRQYFAAQGPAAWSKGTVPHYITSNPYAADAAAKIIAGFLRDVMAAQSEATHTYIVELGAGSGRFSFHLLERLCRLLQDEAAGTVPFTYVITDFAAANVQFCRRHPLLRRYVERGLVDFAVFDVEADEKLTLLDRGITIGAETENIASVWLANYIFDSIPHDLFRLTAAGIEEGLVTVASRHGEELKADDPDLLHKLQLSYQWRLLPDGVSGCGDQAADAVLHSYHAKHDSGIVVFPTAAIRCVDRLKRIGRSGKWLMLAADKGDFHEEAQLLAEAPEMAVHGSVSINVNFHALGQCLAASGGEMTHSCWAHEHIALAMLFREQGGCRYAQTRASFREAVEQFGPDDYFTLRQSIKAHYGAMDARQLLAYAKWTSWDAKSFLDYFPHLIECISREEQFPRDGWLQAASQIWNGYYDIGEAVDVPFHLGLLLYTMDYEREALLLLRHSLQTRGPRARLYYYIGLCHYYIDEAEEAADCWRKSLLLDDTMEESREMLLELERQADRGEAT